MDLPIACTLTAAQLQERRQQIMNVFRSMDVTAIELGDGFAFKFPKSSEALQRITELVDMERQCCSFLTFNIFVEEGQPDIRLEVWGPEGAKKLIAEYFHF